MRNHRLFSKPGTGRTSGMSIALVILALAAVADEPRQTIPDPGFRPPNEHAAAFIDALDTATIAVLPTMIRRLDRTAHSFDSQQQIASFINDNGMAVATLKPRRIGLGALSRQSQWEIFQHGAARVTEALAGYDTGTDFTLVLEVLVPGDEAVFGIEVYIVDSTGEHVFSFLLNSHHELFAEADLAAKGSSEAARGKMIERATSVGMAALIAQIEEAREVQP